MDMSGWGLHPSPEEKGIKTIHRPSVRRVKALHPSPEEKGIKTAHINKGTALFTLHPSPEEKGIKTGRQVRCGCGPCYTRALKKKGLRPTVALVDGCV